MNIAFLGLGAMGRRMVMQLAKTHHNVTIWNRTQGIAEQLVNESSGKLILSKTPQNACRGAQVIISMLRDDLASKNIWKEMNLIHSLNPAALVIECSTLSPAWVTELDRLCGARHVGFIDAPVVGSLPQAESGNLHFFIGGSSSNVEKAEPILSVMAQALHHIGEIGAGSFAKLVNNAYLGIQVASLAELLNVLQKSNVDTHRAISAIQSTPLASPISKLLTQLILEDRHEPLFPVDLMEKDLNYFTKACDPLKANAPLSIATHNAFSQAIDANLGKLNMTAIAKLLSNH